MKKNIFSRIEHGFALADKTGAIKYWAPEKNMVIGLFAQLHGGVVLDDSDVPRYEKLIATRGWSVHRSVRTTEIVKDAPELRVAVR